MSKDQKCPPHNYVNEDTYEDAYVTVFYDRCTKCGDRRTTTKKK